CAIWQKISPAVPRIKPSPGAEGTGKGLGEGALPTVNEPQDSSNVREMLSADTQCARCGATCLPGADTCWLCHAPATFAEARVSNEGAPAKPAPTADPLSAG